MMIARFAAALAVACAVGAAKAPAADLGYGYPVDQTYEDGGYGAGGGYCSGAGCDTAERYGSADYEEYGEQYGENGYGGTTRRTARHEAWRTRRQDCIRRFDIEDNLLRQGWRDIGGFVVEADTLGLTARRPNGLVYRLRIDRCSGVIIAASLLDQPDRRRRTFTSQYLPSF
ncbi:MAG: hypothetical protein R3D33_13120 [Hyphomicrobiaceae bacterium]